MAKLLRQRGCNDPLCGGDRLGFREGGRKNHDVTLALFDFGSRGAESVESRIVGDTGEHRHSGLLRGGSPVGRPGGGEHFSKLQSVVKPESGLCRHREGWQEKSEQTEFVHLFI